MAQQAYLISQFPRRKRLRNLQRTCLQVDVAIVGGGLCGLACAAALHNVHPDCKIKVSVAADTTMIFV
jgi:ribulose 1,5-bisphosphate synthetase/thiazole synthase